jgi:hypothetical protein
LRLVDDQVSSEYLFAEPQREAVMKKTYTKAFVERVREERAKGELTIEQLAEKFKIGTASVKRWTRPDAKEPKEPKEPNEPKEAQEPKAQEPRRARGGAPTRRRTPRRRRASRALLTKRPEEVGDGRCGHEPPTRSQEEGLRKQSAKTSWKSRVHDR